MGRSLTHFTIVHPYGLSILIHTSWLLPLLAVPAQRIRQYLHPPYRVHGVPRHWDLWTVLLKPPHRCAALRLDHLHNLFPRRLQMSHVLDGVAYPLWHKRLPHLHSHGLLGLRRHQYLDLCQCAALWILWLLLQRTMAEHLSGRHGVVGFDWCHHAIYALVRSSW